MTTTATAPPLPAGTWNRLDGNHLLWISDTDPAFGTDLLRLTGGTHPDSGEYFATIQIATTHDDVDPADSESVGEALEYSAICVLPATALPYLHKAIGAIIGAQAEKIVDQIRE